MALACHGHENAPRECVLRRGSQSQKCKTVLGRDTLSFSKKGGEPSRHYSRLYLPLQPEESRSVTWRALSQTPESFCNETSKIPNRIGLSMRSLMNRHALWLGLRIACGMVLLGLLVTWIDWLQFHTAIYNLNPMWASGGLLVMLSVRLLAAYKWHLLIRDQTDNVTLTTSVRMLFVSDFLSSFLPSGLGNDTTRAFLLMRVSSHLVVGLSSVLMDRMLGSWVMLILAVLALKACPVPFPHRDAIMLVVIICLILSIAGLIVVMEWRTAIDQFVQRLPRIGLRAVKFIDALITSLDSYRKNRRLVFVSLVLGVVMQALRIFSIYMFGIALGDQTSLSVYSAFVLIIFVINQIPFSIDSIGVREAFYIYLYGLAGVPMELAVAIALVTRLAGYLLSVPGMILYVRHGLSIKGSSAVT